MTFPTLPLDDGVAMSNRNAVHGWQEDDFELLRDPSATPARGFAHGQHCRAVLELVHKLREYARHAPMCSYAPTYPEGDVATCDCGFDAVLDDYDRTAAL